MKTTSPFGSINWKDLLWSGLSALIFSVGTALITIFQNLQDTGHLDMTLQDLYKILGIGIGAGVVVILKQLMQNSNGKHFKKE